LGGFWGGAFDSLLFFAALMKWVTQKEKAAAIACFVKPLSVEKEKRKHTHARTHGHRELVL
jgi:hypothetical protein